MAFCADYVRPHVRLCALALGVTAALLAPATAVGQSAAPLTLAEAQDLARANSFALGRARAAVSAAESDVRAARAAGRPTLGVSAGFAFADAIQPDIVIERGSFGTLPNPGATFPTQIPPDDLELVPGGADTFYTLGFSFSQVISAAGAIREGRRAAQAQLAARRSSLAGSERDTRAEVAQTYFGLVAARESTSILGRMEALQRGITDDRRRQFDAGSINRQELLESEYRLAELVSQRVATEEAGRTAAAALSRLLGVAGEPADGFRDPVSLPEVAELVERALEDNPDLAELTAQAEAAQWAVRLARSQAPRRPQVGFSFDLDFRGSVSPFDIGWRNDWDTGVQIALGVQTDLFDGGAGLAAVAGAEAQLEHARLGAAELEQSVPLQVQRAVELYRAAAARSEALTARRAWVEEQARNAQVSFENDLITAEEVRGAELVALQVALEELEARYSREQARIGLESLVGPLTD